MVKEAVNLMKKILVWAVCSTVFATGVLGCGAGSGSSTNNDGKTNEVANTADTTAPSIPAGLAATATNSSSIGLTWNSSTDNVGVSTYEVYRDNVLLSTTNTTFFSDSGLNAATQYCYTVRAKDAANNYSALSSQDCESTEADAAVDETGTDCATGIALTSGTPFSGAINPDYDIDYFRITANAAGKINVTLNVVSGDAQLYLYDPSDSLVGWSTTSGTVDEMITNYSVGSSATGDYCIKVMPNILSLANYNLTATFGATGAADTSAPTVPTGLKVIPASATSMTVTWTASTDNIGVTGYDVYRGGSKIATTASLLYSDTTVTASTQYCYSVKAHDATNNNSAATSDVCATTPAAGGGTTADSECATTNDTSDAGCPLTVGNSVNGSIGTGTDNYDWFTFTTNSAGTINITLVNMTADLDLKLLKAGAGSTSVADSNQSGTVNEAITYVADAAGTFYLRVSRYGTGSSLYLLTVTLTP